MGLLVARLGASRIASRIRHVQCESCKQPYAYELIRRGEGTSGSLLWLENADARERAAHKAEIAAEKAVGHGHDPVSCPSCGHVQEAAIRDIARRRMQIPTTVIGMIAATCVLVPTAMLVKEWSSVQDRARLLRACFVVGGGGLAACAFAYLVFRRILRFDRPRFELLAPHHKYRLAQPALTFHMSGGGQYLAPAKPVQLVQSRRGLIIQLHRIGIPDTCLGCGEPTRRMFAPPVAMDHEIKTYSCCERCQSRLAKRWRIVSAAVVLGCLSAAAGAATIPWVNVATLRYIVAVTIVVLVLPIAAIVVPNVVGQPLKRRSVDRARGWVCIRSDSPKYQQLLEDRYRNPANYTFRDAGISFADPYRPSARSFKADKVRQ
jgi:hypothetical protein